MTSKRGWTKAHLRTGGGFEPVAYIHPSVHDDELSELWNNVWDNVKSKPGVDYTD